METVITTQLSADELKTLVKDGVSEYFVKNPLPDQSIPSPSDLGGMDLAVEITGYAKATIYGLINDKAIPYFKNRGRLYFSRSELFKWVQSGKVSTVDEMEATANDHLDNSER